MARRNLSKERRRFGFWRWYLPRLVKQLAVTGFYLGGAAVLMAFVWFVCFPAVGWLVEAPLYLQITIPTITIFTIVSFIAWGIHWAEIHEEAH